VTKTSSAKLLTAIAPTFFFRIVFLFLLLAGASSTILITRAGSNGRCHFGYVSASGTISWLR